MTLCKQISGTFPKEAFAPFNTEYNNPLVRQYLEKCATVQSLLKDLVTTSTQPALTKTATGCSVLQVRPKGYGYIVKMSAAPEGVAPQQAEMSAQEAASAGVPPEMLQQADQQGVSTVTDVQAAPDPMVETPQLAGSFGMYKVVDAANGRQVVGFVIPGLFDPMVGQPTQMSLFTTGNSYALQPQIMGVLTGISFNLPEANPPRGLGIFYKTDGKTLMATVPYNIVSEVTVEGRVYYSAQTQEGRQLQLVMSQGLKRPIATSQTEVAVPADFKFLPLDNPIQLYSGENMMKSAQAAAYDTMIEMRAWDGGIKLSGPVFEKLGSGQHSWEDGLFYLAAAGLQQQLAIPLLEKAAHSGQVIRLFGLNPLSSAEEQAKHASTKKTIAVTKLAAALPKTHCLLREAIALSMDKEASALIGTSTVDNILALNFLTPENTAIYAEYIPQLKESAEKLAELVLACQLGLSQVPKTAAVRAMFALESVVDGLLQLKEYKL